MILILTSIHNNYFSQKMEENYPYIIIKYLRYPFLW